MSDNSPKAPSPEHLAQLLPQYGIESFIAQGGMGAVYKGRQISLDRDVAIKVLSTELGSNPQFRESFTTEAKAMARLNHPNLLGVFDYGDVDGMPYIVMEYVHGGSLHQAAWNQSIEPTAAATIVKGICDGLAHAHEHGIVHRDIKPSNILLATATEPKVADFGLANAADSDDSGLAMGTPGYTAPEVFHDPAQAGKLADIYSVGVILHQLLTGIDPAGSYDPPNTPTSFLRLDAIWRKATNINPTQRYPDIAAMASDLEKWLSVKQRGPMASHYRPVVSQRQTGGDGGGMLTKIFILGVLGAIAFFSYQHVQKQKEESKERREEINETDPFPDTGSPASAPEPAPLPPFETDRHPIPEPDDVDPREPEETDGSPEAGIQPKRVREEDLPPGDPKLRQRAINLILEARKKRDQEFSDNARSLIFSIDSIARTSKTQEANLLERLKGDIEDNVIPLTDNVHGLPDKITRLFEYARAREASSRESHSANLTRIRNAYVTRLERAAAEANGNHKKLLEAQAKRAGDLDKWIAELSPEPKKEPKESFGCFGPAGIIGEWDEKSENGTKLWIAHPDGSLEIGGRKRRSLTWEFLEDGTLKIHWRRRDSSIYRQDGKHWIGTNSRGEDSILTRRGQ